MNILKLLIVYPIDPYGEKYGGIETNIKSFIKDSPKSFEFELIGIKKKGSRLKLLKWQNIIFEGKKIRFIPILNVKDPNTRTLIPLTLKFVINLFLHKGKIDFRNRIIIFHRVEPAYALYSLKEKKILFIHGDIRNFINIYCESRWRRIRSLYYFLDRFVIKNMIRIFIVSQKGLEYYRHKFPKYTSRFKFLPTWYDPLIFHKFNNLDRAKILSKYKILDKRPIILFVGRLELAKDPILLIDSFYLLTKKFPNSQLIIIGDGTLRQKILKKANFLFGNGNVIFLSKRTQTEIAEIMNVSDLLLLTSRFEGMPSVVLESLACGLPVVSTNTGDSSLVIKN
ncbi:unnamed protein product [marine sediment metagenome]|uniref:Glycosyl transferase family 1 domain-containing protein n=1 Tax=marine sediment metagenome TaxID=412755 RepID=X0YLH7_9ZZZZ